VKYLGWLLALVVVLAAVQWFRPLPKPTEATVVPSSYTFPGRLPSLPWPSQGQAAVAVEGVGLVASTPGQTSVPIASLTKLMTAYVVLHAHPLAIGQTGPTITVTPKDVTLYNQEKATQSVAQVAAGEQLTEYQLLEGLLIPSANNFADMLADWVAGSRPAFVQMMNQTARRLGLSQTHFADVSGVNPGSVSTADDIIRLAMLDMQNPVFRSIVAMPQATLPVAGVVYNVNYYLGHSGIIGVKTGSTNEAGGCYVAAAYRPAGSQRVLVLSAVLGQQSARSELFKALNAGEALLNAVPFLETRTVLPSGAPVVQVRAPWVATGVNALAPAPVTVVGWPGLTVHFRVHLRPLPKTVAAGTPVGTLVAQAGQQTVTLPLKTSGALPPPSKHWRLLRL
jgi:D-alanyl-D-alanine carboxypeptidase (penicillin-binding protein 5/6)